MKILIVYGTSEGQTRKISYFMEEVLQSKNHQVVVADVTQEPPNPEKFDMILVGSSIHAHKYSNVIKHYIIENVDVLSSKPSAFFSVCLAVASQITEEHEEVEKIATDFIEHTGWEVDTVWHIAGALRYTKYDYFKRLIMRMIAKKQGGAVDTSKDHEYTDWDKVKGMVLDFVSRFNI